MTGSNGSTFRRGDLVRCVRADLVPGLHLDREYEVLDAYEDVVTVRMGSDEFTGDSNRFVPAESRSASGGTGRQETAAITEERLSEIEALANGAGPQPPTYPWVNGATDAIFELLSEIQRQRDEIEALRFVIATAYVDLDQYVLQAGDEAHAGPVGVRAQLRNAAGPKS